MSIKESAQQKYSKFCKKINKDKTNKFLKCQSQEVLNQRIHMINGHYN